MSENNTQLNDVTGSALSGIFNAEVHIASGPDVDELAEKLIAKHGPVRAEMAVSMGTNQRLVELEKRFDRRAADDQLDRVWRQRETDIHRQEIADQLKAINNSLAALQPRLARTETSAWRALLGSMISLVIVIVALWRGRR